MANLPKPDVTVVEASSGSDKGIAITVTRDGKGRTWSGEGSNVADAVKGAVEKMLGDPRTGEYL